MKEEPGVGERGRFPTARTPAVAWGQLISWRGQLELHTEKGNMAGAEVEMGASSSFPVNLLAGCGGGS